MEDKAPDTLDGPGSRPWQSDTCWDCKHLRGGRVCDAFPEEGVPDALWNAWRAHREPYPGDHGIQYERMAAPAAPVEIPEFLRKKPA